MPFLQLQGAGQWRLTRRSSRTRPASRGAPLSAGVGPSVRADLLIPLWFLVPWLMLAAKVTRLSIYGMRLGIFRNLPPFPFAEMLKRVNDQRRTDPIYERMHRDTWLWFKITAAWWVLSFVGLVGGALLYGTLRS
jgi:hypothetical protein